MDYERFFALTTFVSFLMVINLCMAKRLYKINEKYMAAIACVIVMLTFIFEPPAPYTPDVFPFKAHVDKLGQIIIGDRPLFEFPDY